MTPTQAPPGRRREILDAALAAFTEYGFAAATVEDVRRRSGASVGSIYHHFGDKEGIAAALYAQGLRDYQAGFLRTLSRHRDAERGVKALVRHHLRWVRGNRDMARFLFNRRETEVLAAAGEEVDELNRVVFGETEAWLRRHVEAGRIRRLPLDLYTTVLIGPSQEFARHWLQGRMKTSMTTAERELADAAWSALRMKGDRDG